VGYYGATVEAAACSRPELRMVVSFGPRVKDGGVLKEGRQWQPCLGQSRRRDAGCLEKLVSVGRGHTRPKILGHRHPIRDLHLPLPQMGDTRNKDVSHISLKRETSL
jgi:hypothetical protein